MMPADVDAAVVGEAVVGAQHEEVAAVPHAVVEEHLAAAEEVSHALVVVGGPAPAWVAEGVPTLEHRVRISAEQAVGQDLAAAEVDRTSVVVVPIWVADRALVVVAPIWVVDQALVVVVPIWVADRALVVVVPIWVADRALVVVDPI